MTTTLEASVLFPSREMVIYGVRRLLKEVKDRQLGNLLLSVEEVEALLECGSTSSAQAE
jgi:hypothetical protein